MGEPGLALRADQASTDVAMKSRPASGRPAGRHRAWRVLRYPDFRRYFIGNVCSNLGTWLQNTAQVLLAYRMGSVAMVGLVTCVQFSSALIFGPWAGMLADRFDRRRILLATQAVSAMIASTEAGLEFTGHLTGSLLVLGAFGIGLAFTFTLPAVTAIIPALVPADAAKDAMAMNAVSFNIGRALAPIAGAGLIIGIGYGWAFALNAASFVVLAAMLLLVNVPETARPPRPPRVLDGLRIAKHERPVMLLLIAAAMTTVATDPPTVLGSALAEHSFHVSGNWGGYFLAALGIGSVMTALLPATGASSSQAAALLGVLGLAIGLFALAPSLWISVTAVIAAGAIAVLAGATTQTLLLNAAGPERAGRVMAVWTIAYAGSRPIASLVDGWIASRLGPRPAGAFIALCVIATAAAAFIIRSRIRRISPGAARAREIADSSALASAGSHVR